MEKSSSIQKEHEIDFQNQNKKQIIDELMNLYSRDVYLLAYSYVKDHGLAEDISQEVFIRGFKFIGNFRGDSSVKSWLYRITVNTSKDYIRKRRFNVFTIANSFFEQVNNTESSEEAFIKNQQNDQLLNTVLSLNSKYREVIVLYYFHDLKTEEIGDLLKLNTNTVKTRLARGRSMLKDKLDPVKGEMFNG